MQIVTDQLNIMQIESDNIMGLKGGPPNQTISLSREMLYCLQIVTAQLNIMQFESDNIMGLKGGTPKPNYFSFS